MATTKQVKAAKRNIKKARAGAQQKRSIAYMPAKTRSALGKQGAAVAQRKRTGASSPKTRQELDQEAKRRNLPGRSKMGRCGNWHARWTGHSPQQGGVLLNSNSYRLSRLSAMCRCRVSRWITGKEVRREYLHLSRAVITTGKRKGATWPDLTGFDVEATDGKIGKVDEATYETEASTLVVDTGFWIFGKKRMIPAGVVENIDTDDKTVVVRMTKDQIKQAPDYDPDRYHSDQKSYRSELGDYYTPYGGS